MHAISESLHTITINQVFGLTMKAFFYFLLFFPLNQAQFL